MDYVGRVEYKVSLFLSTYDAQNDNKVRIPLEWPKNILLYFTPRNIVSIPTKTRAENMKWLKWLVLMHYPEGVEVA